MNGKSSTSSINADLRRVLVESPWSGNIRKHRNYARKCIRDCLQRGEAPIASHLLFTQPGILKDHVDEERMLGISAGLAWSEVADAAVFYADYGFSIGMQYALKAHAERGTPIEVRYLFKRSASPRRRTREKSAFESGSDASTDQVPTAV